MGGLASKFHVLELSHNHFRFSVSCKAVSFSVYALRRVIGNTFDVYFHLWNNGVPHWEQEKRLWEEEEAKKWTKVLSKSQKRNAKSQASVIKKIRFAPKLVLESPAKKFTPAASKSQLISFGAFSTLVDVSSCLDFSPFTVLPPEDDSAQSVQSGSSPASAKIRPALKKTAISDDLNSGSPPGSAAQEPRPSLKGNQFPDLNFGSSFPRNNYEHVTSPSEKRDYSINSVQCSKCLRLGHFSRGCRSLIHCLVYFNYGHRARQCLNRPILCMQWRPKQYPTKSKPVLSWRPKYPIDWWPNSDHQSTLLGGSFTTSWKMHDNVGVGEQAIGDLGINVQQMQEINQDINLVGHNAAH